MKFVILIIILLVFGVLIPKFSIQNSPSIDPAKAKCGILGTRMLLENPFERLWTMKLSAKNQAGDDVFVVAYTLFGIKYAEVRADCSDIDEAGHGGGAQVLRRGLFF